MIVTGDHPDAPHIQVMFNGEPLEDCIKADTVGGFVVLRDPPRGSATFQTYEFGLEYQCRTRFGKVELIDKRTGKPYDELYQAAEKAARQVASWMKECE